MENHSGKEALEDPLGNVLPAALAGAVLAVTTAAAAFGSAGTTAAFGSASTAASEAAAWLFDSGFSVPDSGFPDGFSGGLSSWSVGLSVEGSLSFALSAESPPTLALQKHAAWEEMLHKLFMPGGSSNATENRPRALQADQVANKLWWMAVLPLTHIPVLRLSVSHNFPVPSWKLYHHTLKRQVVVVVQQRLVIVSEVAEVILEEDLG